MLEFIAFKRFSRSSSPAEGDASPTTISASIDIVHEMRRSVFAPRILPHSRFSSSRSYLHEIFLRVPIWFRLADAKRRGGILTGAFPATATLDIGVFYFLVDWPASRRQSSINLSTSLGSNRSGLLPGPIFTAGRYGLRLPEACCITQETLTPSFCATFRARTNCLIRGASSTARVPLSRKSIPLNRGIRCSSPVTLAMILFRHFWP